MATIHAATPAVGTTFLACDMGALATVRAACAQLAAATDRLDVLVCNAGVMALPAELTRDGYELQFGTNHVAHALFAKLLRPLMDRAPDPRLVVLTSQAFTSHPPGGIVFDALKTPQDRLGGTWLRYGQSKLANLLYAAELARRFPHITTVSVHPGIIFTGLVMNLGLVHRMFVYAISVGRGVTPEEGAYNTLWAATADKAGIVNGEYYEPVGKLGRHARESKNAELAAKLWDWTEKELEGYTL
jgi:NAD(P)-dependent dehydrogenase (short-subunit alcohol dehydrogenase family)